MKQLFRQQLKVLEQQHPGAMVVLLNLRGEYLYASPEVRSLLGYTPSEVVGRPATEFAAVEDIPHVELTLQDALLNNESVTVNIRVRTKSGELRPARGQAFSMADPETNEVYILGWVARIP